MYTCFVLRLKQILKFVKLTLKFGQVKRTILIPAEVRLENDLEHSSQLALVAWYISNSNKLKLNTEKVLQYALIHDLVEVYAGDTPFHKQDKIKKGKLEQIAIKRLKRNFPEFAGLAKTISQYESKNDTESKFIYALDKVLPMLNIYLDKGRTWKKFDVSLDVLIRHKSQAVAKSPDVLRYFDQLVSLLKKKKHFFNKNKP